MFDVVMNYWAVFVSAAGSLVLGGLWYSPLLFGKTWMHHMGLQKVDMEKHKNEALRGYAISFISSLVMAYALGMFVYYAGAMTVLEGAEVGFIAWLGFVATTSLGNVLWEGKKFILYLVNVGYHLVLLVGMGILLTVWQ